MAQDLNILAEAGVNARKYIKDAFNMTVEEIQESGMDIQKVMDAIFAGMAQQFGGASKRMASTWDGVVTQLNKAWQEFAITLGDTGFFEGAKREVQELTGMLKAMSSVLAWFNKSSDERSQQQEWERVLSLRHQEKGGFVFPGTASRAEIAFNKKWVGGSESEIANDAAFKAWDKRSSWYESWREKEGRFAENTKEQNEAIIKAREEMLKKNAEAAKKAQDEIRKLNEEVSKLEQEFKDSIIFGGEDSAYERMQAQIRSGSQIAQMEADRAKYVSEQWDEAFKQENDRLSSRVAAWEQANRDIIDAEKRQQEILKDTADVMTQNFSDAFAEFVTGSKNAKEAFEDMVQSIISGMVRMASQRMFEQIFGMALKGFGSYSASQLPINQPGFPGAGTFHSGGVVGVSGGPTRSIPAAAFSFAPRLHSGLMGDEYPAILQKGETVIPRGGAGGVTNNYYSIQAMDVRSFADYLRRSGAVPAIVSEDIRGNGITRKTMRGKW
jgi:hypothetical protein